MLTLACAATFGCNAKKKSCEHARDVAVAELDRMYENAPEGLEDQAKQRRTDQVAKVDAHFMTACMELDEQGRACIERIDEITETNHAAQVGIEACAAAGGEGLLTCFEAVERERREKLGDCEELLDALSDDVLARTD